MIQALRLRVLVVTSVAMSVTTGCVLAPGMSGIGVFNRVETSIADEGTSVSVRGVGVVVGDGTLRLGVVASSVVVIPQTEAGVALSTESMTIFTGRRAEAAAEAGTAIEGLDP